MVDYVEHLHEQAGVESKPDFAKLREDATVKFKSLQERAQAVISVIEDPEAVAKLRSGSDRDKNLEMLKSEYNVGPGEE
jgi:translation initiation factor 3 subunit E